MGFAALCSVAAALQQRARRGQSVNTKSMTSAAHPNRQEARP